MASHKQYILPAKPDGEVDSAQSQCRESNSSGWNPATYARGAGKGLHIKCSLDLVKPSTLPGNWAWSEEFGILFSLVGKYLQIVHRTLRLCVKLIFLFFFLKPFVWLLGGGDFQFNLYFSKCIHATHITHMMRLRHSVSMRWSVLFAVGYPWASKLYRLVTCLDFTHLLFISLAWCCCVPFSLQSKWAWHHVATISFA